MNAIKNFFRKYKTVSIIGLILAALYFVYRWYLNSQSPQISTKTIDNPEASITEPTVPVWNGVPTVDVPVTRSNSPTRSQSGNPYAPIPQNFASEPIVGTVNSSPVIPSHSYAPGSSPVLNRSDSAPVTSSPITQLNRG